MQRGNTATTLFPLLLTAFLAAATYWLEMASRPTHPDNNGKLRHDPDYIVDNFRVRRFDDTGVLQSTLVAESMRHYPDDDSTVVSAPDLTYHRDPPTVVRAREGRIDSTGEHVELIDSVRITRDGKAGKPPTVLTTARLDAYPDDEIARSHVPVTIIQGLSRTVGNTLDANNKTGIYVLEGAVRGVYHRNGGLAPPSGTMSPVTAPQPASKPAAKPVAASPKPKARPVAKAKPRNTPQPSSKNKPKR